jgi:hypothetical protein
MHRLIVEGDNMVLNLKRVKDAFDMDDLPYDPLWDDDADWAVPDPEEDEQMVQKELFHSLPENVPESDETIVSQSKLWVDTMMSSLALCPFTSGAEMAGLPMGQIRYEVDRIKSIEGVYEKYWNEVMLMDEANEKEVRMMDRMLRWRSAVTLRLWEGDTHDISTHNALHTLYITINSPSRCRTTQNPLTLQPLRRGSLHSCRFPPPCSSPPSSVWAATMELSTSRRSPRP